MIFISHRGNLYGPNKKLENSINYIMNALKKNFHVEIDVWFKKGKFYLGHDNPKFFISKKFLQNKKLWCHAKNLEALEALKKINARFFWHQNDDAVLTSDGYFWTYPGKKTFKNSISVLPEIKKIKKFRCAGICSDYISDYKKCFK